MAVSSGPWQSYARIEWEYSVGKPSQSSTSVYVTVKAYLRMDGYSSQYYNGSKAWSGQWGSGSAAQYYGLGPNQRVLIVTWGGNVSLTDSARTVAFGASAHGYHGSTASTLVVSIPARYARTPSSLTATRASDSRINLQWSRNSTYSAVVVQRSVDGGAWQQVARPTGNAYSWADTTVQAGRQYRYRVAGVGGSGQSGWSNVATAYTSPLAPTGVTAARSGNDIVVSVSGKPKHATSFDVMDGSTVVATGVSVPWRHAAPAASSAHQYKVRGKVAGLTGAWSAASNSVQLIQVPLAPLANSLGGVMPSDAPVEFSWKHNPVDSSLQSAFELQYRLDGGAWVTVTGTTASSVAVALPASTVEYQVRTKGAHASWSPWSSIGIGTIIDRPGLAITGPEELVLTRQVEVTWSWYQEQAWPQYWWEMEVYGPDGLVEARSGNGAAGRALIETRLQHGLEYEVRVRGWAGMVESEWALSAFRVEVPSAAPALVLGAWDEVSGSVTLDAADGRGPAVPEVRNFFVNPLLRGANVWAVVSRNLLDNATLSASTCRWSGPAGTRIASEQGRVFENTAVVGNGASAAWHPEMTVANSSNVPVVLTMLVRNVGSTSAHVVLGANWRATAGGAQIHATFAETAQVLLPGDEALLVASWVIPSAAVRVGVNLRAGAGGVPAGSRLEVVDGASMQPEGCPPRLFHDGVSDDPDLRARSLGTPNSSVVVLEGEMVDGVGGFGGVTPIKSEWEGRPAVRLVVTGNPSGTDNGASLPVPQEVMDLGGVMLGTRCQKVAGVLGAADFNLAAWEPFVEAAATSEAGEVPARLVMPDSSQMYFALLGGHSYVGAPDVWWTDIAFASPGYAGPAFHGGSGLVKAGRTWMATKWDGAIGASSSTAFAAPLAVRADVERSRGGGQTWELIATNEALPLSLVDGQSLSNGVTRYRVTTYSADDAMSAVVHEVVADSPAAWLSGGRGFTHVARLPYDPVIRVEAGRERSLERYAGRSRGVVYSGEQVSRVAEVSGRTRYRDADTADVDALERVAQDPAPLHMLRMPDGRLITGMLSAVSLERQSRAGIWGYSFVLEEGDQ